MTDFKNIIFDFGGVIIDIDYKACAKSFENLGFTEFEKWFSKGGQSHLFDELETGRISPDDFRKAVRKEISRPLTDDQIDAAWNSILIDLPEVNVRLLERLKPNYRIFLLSNTNEIHEKAFTELIMRQYGKNILPELFENIYYSHRIGLRKPGKEVFDHVVKENNLLASETLLIDDSPQHIEGGKKAGLQTFLLEKGKKITELF